MADHFLPYLILNLKVSFQFYLLLCAFSCSELQRYFTCIINYWLGILIMYINESIIDELEIYHVVFGNMSIKF